MEKNEEILYVTTSASSGEGSFYAQVNRAVNSEEFKNRVVRICPDSSFTEDLTIIHGAQTWIRGSGSTDVTIGRNIDTGVTFVLDPAKISYASISSTEMYVGWDRCIFKTQSSLENNGEENTSQQMVGATVYGLVEYNNCIWKDITVAATGYLFPYNNSSNGTMKFMNNIAYNNTCTYQFNPPSVGTNIFTGCTLADPVQFMANMASQRVTIYHSLYAGKSERETGTVIAPATEVASWHLTDQSYESLDSDFIKYPCRVVVNYDLAREQYDSIYEAEYDFKDTPRYGFNYCYPGAYATPVVIIEKTEDPTITDVPWVGQIYVDDVYVYDTSGSTNPEVRWEYDTTRPAPSIQGYCEARTTYVVGNIKDISTPLASGQRTLTCGNLFQYFVMHPNNWATERNITVSDRDVHCPLTATGVTIECSYPEELSDISPTMTLVLKGKTTGRTPLTAGPVRMWIDPDRGSGFQEEYQNLYYDSISQEAGEITYTNLTPWRFMTYCMTMVDDNSPAVKTETYDYGVLYSCADNPVYRILCYIGDDESGSFTTRTDWTLQWDKTDRPTLMQTPVVEGNVFIVNDSIEK